MEMQIDHQRIRAEREKRAWSQSHLATICGLGLRTIQRIEATGSASYESAAALASAFSLTVAELLPSGAVAVSPAVSESGATVAPRPIPAGRQAVRIAIGVVAVAAAAGVAFVLDRMPMDGGRARPAVETALTQAEPARREAIAECVPRFDGRGPWVGSPALQCEQRDPVWAPDMEGRLGGFARTYSDRNPELREEWSFSTVECRSTICALRFVDSTPAGGFVVTPNGVVASNGADLHSVHAYWLSSLSWEIYGQPWGAAFLWTRTSIVGSARDGTYVLYLQTNPARMSRL